MFLYNEMLVCILTSFSLPFLEIVMFSYAHVELFGLDLTNLCNNDLNKIALVSAEALHVFDHVISKSGMIWLNMLEAFGENKITLKVLEEFVFNEDMRRYGNDTNFMECYYYPHEMCSIHSCINTVIASAVNQKASIKREELNKTGIEKVFIKYFPNKKLKFHWR
jgi:hypothetical protein